MEIVTVAVYTLKELTEAAQKRAHNDWLILGQWFYHAKDWAKTGEEFLGLLPDGTSCAMTLDTSRHPFSAPDETFLNLKGPGAWQWLSDHGLFTVASKADDLPLTGFHGDADVLTPLLQYQHAPEATPTVAQVLQECTKAWHTECIKDRDRHASREYFVDACRVNGWRFLPDGSMFLYDTEQVPS